MSTNLYKSYNFFGIMFAMKIFHEWLKQELFKRELTQKEFADMINTSQGMASRYLSGKDKPSAITLVKTAKAFNLPEKEVLNIGGYDEEYRKLPETRIVGKTVNVPYEYGSIEEAKYLDKKLDSLCTEIESLAFSRDNKQKISIEAKRAIVNFLESALEIVRLKEGDRKEENKRKERL